MRHYKLEYLPLFSEELSQAVRYISFILKNPQTTQRLVLEIEAAIHKRIHMPEAFTPPYPSDKNHEYPYYTIRVRNFIVFYVVIGDTMEVRRLIYNRRNITEII